MKFYLLFAFSCVLLANIIAATSEHHQKYKLARTARSTDDDEDEDVPEDKELEANLARKPKITRPAWGEGPKKNLTTTTPAPVSEKVDQPTAAPAAAVTDRQSAVDSRPSVDSARSFVDPRPLPFAPQSPPPPQPRPSVQWQPAAPLYTGFQSNSQFARPYQAKADSAAAAQWGVKGGRVGGKGVGKGSAFWYGKGLGGQQQQQQQQLQQQAIVKSPIARGKSMYSPRPQVPMVVAPLPQTDLQVPAAVPVENSVQQQQQQPRQQQQWQPQQQQQRQPWQPQEQQQVSSRFQDDEGGNQVNSFRQSQPPASPAPVYHQSAPVAQVMPIARGSRPRSSKSKYVDVNDYQQREELSPDSSRPKPLARAAVSEQAQGAFALDDCPYGMRLSMCRLRAAQRLRS